MDPAHHEECKREINQLRAKLARIGDDNSQLRNNQSDDRAQIMKLRKMVESAIKGFEAIDGIKAHEGAQCRMAMIAAVHLAELRAV